MRDSGTHFGTVRAGAIRVGLGHHCGTVSKWNGQQRVRMRCSRVCPHSSPLPSPFSVTAKRPLRFSSSPSEKQVDVGDLIRLLVLLNAAHLHNHTDGEALRADRLQVSPRTPLLLGGCTSAALLSHRCAKALSSLGVPKCRFGRLVVFSRCSHF